MKKYIQWIYEQWLLDVYADEVHTTEELDECLKEGRHWEEFRKELLKEVSGEDSSEQIKRIADSMEWIVKSLKKNKLYIGVLR